MHRIFIRIYFLWYFQSIFFCTKPKFIRPSSNLCCPCGCSYFWKLTDDASNAPGNKGETNKGGKKPLHTCLNRTTKKLDRRRKKKAFLHGNQTCSSILRHHSRSSVLALLHCWMLFLGLFLFLPRYESLQCCVNDFLRFVTPVGFHLLQFSLYSFFRCSFPCAEQHEFRSTIPSEWRASVPRRIPLLIGRRNAPPQRQCDKIKFCVEAG